MCTVRPMKKQTSTTSTLLKIMYAGPRLADPAKRSGVPTAVTRAGVQSRVAASAARPIPSRAAIV